MLVYAMLQSVRSGQFAQIEPVPGPSGGSLT